MRIFVNQQLYPGEFLLHKKYAKSEMLLELVWTHSNIVADIAQVLLDSGYFDTSQYQREFVIQAALLMDIGTYLCDGFEWMPGQEPAGRPYIQHGVVGAWVLNQEGYSPEIVQVAHSHTGVGLSADDVRNFGLQLPEADYLPFTPLQLIITYASKFHSKAPKFKTREDIVNALSRYGQEKVRRFEELEVQFGQPDLSKVIAKYGQWHQSFQYQIKQVQEADLSVQNQTAMLNSAGIASGTAQGGGAEATQASAQPQFEISSLPVGAATPDRLRTAASGSLPGQ